MLNCTLHISGIPPEQSINAFIRSYQETSKVQHYQKDKAYLEDYFKNKMAGTDVNEHAKFSINITSNEIQFLSDNYDVYKYEYGGDGQPPNRTIKPAVIAVANEVSKIMISDAIKLYNQNTGFGKYSKMLK